MSRAIVKAAQDAIRGLDTLDKSMRTVTKHFKLSDHLSAEITIDLSGLPSVEYTPAFNSHGREDRLTKQERKALVLALDEMDWRLYVESLGGDGAGFDFDAIPEFRTRRLDLDLEDLGRAQGDGDDLRKPDGSGDLRKLIR